MGITLRELLRRLCIEIGWSYSVFWKAIGFGHSMHLVWEDSFYERKSSLFNFDLLLKEQGVVHAIGEGIIGQTALTGNHLWILRDNFLNDSNCIKGISELTNQLAAGIQTAVVIPVLPHGVLQIGSTNNVMENIPFLVLVKSLFSQVQLSTTRPESVLQGPTRTALTRLVQSHSDHTKTLPIPIENTGNSITNLPKEEFSEFSLSGNDLFDMLSPPKNSLPAGNFGYSNDYADVAVPDSSEYSRSGIFSSGGTDQLLDAVVSCINNRAAEQSKSSDDNKSCNTSLNASTCNKNNNNCYYYNNSSNNSNISSNSISGENKSQMQLWIEGGQNVKMENLPGPTSKSADVAAIKPNRKRLRPGENRNPNPKPRPKDRQLIQDRIKELREIVPNGAKCSIDALLEKTIKHMLFLQSVAKHSDKLKESTKSKILGEEGMLMKDSTNNNDKNKNREGGSTWGLEVGPHSMSCPIIVEDLHTPRQLLVQMLCEDRGLFLEIADFIKGLGLTILKGVMEARKNKIWARFAVEANRDVTRMEIFLSLVRLLEPGNYYTGSENSFSHNINNKITQNMNVPHQPSVIPATGSSDFLG